MRCFNCGVTFKPDPIHFKGLYTCGEDPSLQSMMRRRADKVIFQESSVYKWFSEGITELENGSYIIKRNNVRL